jgi:hypothetical protein
MILSGRSPVFGLESKLANVSSPHEQNEVEQQPAQEKQPDGYTSQQHRSVRLFLYRFMDLKSASIFHYFFRVAVG